MPNQYTHAFCRYIGLVLGLVCAVPMAQAELTVTPKFSPTVYVDDNRRLRDEPSGLAASVNKLEMEGVFKRPTYLLNLTPRFRMIRNTSQKELDANDYFVDVSGQKNFLRHQLAAGLSFAHELSATRQLEEKGEIRQEKNGARGEVRSRPDTL
jgi:hypothetical protein